MCLSKELNTTRHRDQVDGEGEGLSSNADKPYEPNTTFFIKIISTSGSTIIWLETLGFLQSASFSK